MSTLAENCNVTEFDFRESIVARYYGINFQIRRLVLCSRSSNDDEETRQKLSEGATSNFVSTFQLYVMICELAS
jgi:hypothetical protein